MSIYMQDPMEFFLKRKNQKVSKAVATELSKVKEMMPQHLENLHNILIHWVGKYMLEHGYEPTESELRTDSFDYGRKTGLGLFLRAERFDDIRGFLLHVYRAANLLKEENEDLIDRMEEMKKEKEELLEHMKKYFNLQPEETDDSD